jgi:hypothetical protein
MAQCASQETSLWVSRGADWLDNQGFVVWRGKGAEAFPEGRLMTEVTLLLDPGLRGPTLQLVPVPMWSSRVCILFDLIKDPNLDPASSDVC